MDFLLKFLDPRLLLFTIALVAGAFGLGYVDGRVDGKKIERGACDREKLDATAMAQKTEDGLRKDIDDLAAEAAGLRALKVPTIEKFTREVIREAPLDPAGVCRWPDGLVRRLNAAATGRFVSDDAGSKDAVPTPSLPPGGRVGAIESRGARPSGQ
jgi:hypothetical protein